MLAFSASVVTAVSGLISARAGAEVGVVVAFSRLAFIGEAAARLFGSLPGANLGFPTVLSRRTSLTAYVALLAAALGPIVSDVSPAAKEEPDSPVG